jgi:dual specificity phosphatase 12
MEEKEILFPYKINEKFIISDLESVTDNYLKENKISHIIIIDKYLELGDKIDSNNYQIMLLDYESPKKDDNFLLGISRLNLFISDNISIFITEDKNSPILPTLISAILIKRKIKLSEIKKIIPESLYKNIYDTYLTKLEEYDKYINDINPEFNFKCGKCRKSLFNDKQLILFHENSAKGTYSHKRKKNNSVNTTECTSYFLNIERLMNNNKNNNEEKKDIDFIEQFQIVMETQNMKLESCIIKCKKCSLKLGEFFDKGIQCSCGSWVVPAVQIVKSKVDKVKIINASK